jgi:Rrf2 family protein
MLSTTDKYALRAAVHLAKQGPTSPMAGHRIAEELGIPPKYLCAILRSLVRVGVLEASPGKNVGFRMVRAPQDVRLFEVLAPFETVVASHQGCPFGHSECSDDLPCSGHERWKRVKVEFDRFLMDTSVHDVSIQPNLRGVDGPRRRKRA